MDIDIGIGLSGVLEELVFGLASFATLTSAGMYSRYKSTHRNLEVIKLIYVIVLL